MGLLVAFPKWKNPVWVWATHVGGNRLKPRRCLSRADRDTVRLYVREKRSLLGDDAGSLLTLVHRLTILTYLVSFGYFITTMRMMPTNVDTRARVYYNYLAVEHYFTTGVNIRACAAPVVRALDGWCNASGGDRSGLDVFHVVDQADRLPRHHSAVRVWQWVFGCRRELSASQTAAVCVPWVVVACKRG